jgi:anti-sigma regulatory factor (Ser/Thr protein kinase)
MSDVFEAEVLPQPEAISALTEEIMDFLGRAGVDARAAHHVGLAFDELLTNLGTHGGSPDNPAKVRVTVGPKDVRSELQDAGPAFDIREAAEPALAESIEDRKIGGLGLFLIRQLAAEIGYERRDGMNCTSFTILRNS